MKEMDEKELILLLIQNNLVSLKLIYGLEGLGLMPEDYYPRLSETIFKLMGFEASTQSDFIFEKIFIANCKKVCSIDIRNSEEGLKELSEAVYEDLLFAKGIAKPE